MVTKGFTKISNSIIFDNDLSIEAIGLYIKISYYISIPNFKINREFVKKISGYGETAFRRVWKELKDNGVLIEKKLRVNGKYEYEYNLLNSKDTVKNETEEKVTLDTTEVEILANETGFTKEESRSLLNVGKDIKEVLKYYRYTLKQKNVKNIFNYTKMCILKKFNIAKDNKTKGSFNNYEQRRYDFNKLESALYGECSLNEAIIY